VTEAADVPRPVSTARRRRLLVAAVVAGEGLFLLALGLFLGVENLVAEAVEPVAAWFLAILTFLLGAALLACARAVLAGSPWVRAPVITWQLLQAFASLPSLRSSAWYVGLPLLVAAVVAGVGVGRPGVVGRRDLPS
jgi:hypothetical protein